MSDAGHVLPWFIADCSSMVRASRASGTLGPHLHPPEMGRRAQKGARLAQGNIGCRVQSQDSKRKLTSGALWEPKDTPSLPPALVRTCQKPWFWALGSQESSGLWAAHYALGASIFVYVKWVNYWET